MSKNKLIIWDLDETLLDTSCLKEARDKRKWKQCRENLDKITEYENMLNVFNDLKKKYKSAIVTNSPKWLAEDICKKFSLIPDLILGYGDTRTHKPKGGPYIKAMETLEITPKNTVAIGDSLIDYQASLDAGIEFIGIGWDEQKYAIFSENNLKRIIRKPKDLLVLLKTQNEK